MALPFGFITLNLLRFLDAFSFHMLNSLAIVFSYSLQGTLVPVGCFLLPAEHPFRRTFGTRCKATSVPGGQLLVHAIGNFSSLYVPLVHWPLAINSAHLQLHPCVILIPGIPLNKQVFFSSL